MLDRERAQRVQNWLQGHGGSYKCPVCGHHHWTVGGIVPAPPDTASGDTEAQAMVQVICGNCAYVVLFSTAGIGF